VQLEFTNWKMALANSKSDYRPNCYFCLLEHLVHNTRPEVHTQPVNRLSFGKGCIRES